MSGLIKYCTNINKCNLLYLELVISASVVEIMAQTTHYQGKGFQITHVIFNMTILKIYNEETLKMV